MENRSQFDSNLLLALNEISGFAGST